MLWAIGLIGLFYLFTLVLGFGAAALVGPGDDRGRAGAANSAAPLLGLRARRHRCCSGIISAVAFATILAVVAGLTITASASFAHDIYASVIQRGSAGRGRGPGGPDLRRRRSASSRSSAASRPTGRTSRSWSRWPSRWRPRRTCRRSCTRCSGSGSTPAAACGASTAAWSSPSSWSSSPRWCPAATTSMFPDVDFAWFPLANPGIVSIPASFLLGYLGTITEQGAPGVQGRRDGGPLADRCGCGGQGAGALGRPVPDLLRPLLRVRPGALHLCETTQVRDQGMGAFGYSELDGRVPGGQAELLRVPRADSPNIKVPDDVLPTAWQAVAYADIPDGRRSPSSARTNRGHVRPYRRAPRVPGDRGGPGAGATRPRAGPRHRDHRSRRARAATSGTRSATAPTTAAPTRWSTRWEWRPTGRNRESGATALRLSAGLLRQDRR